MPITLNGTSGVTTPALNELAYPDASSMGFRNRIINGDMRIDQRNAGAAVTGISTGTNYIVDRWALSELTDAVFTAGQDTSVPTGEGFVNSFKITTTTADASIGATQYAFVMQRIEGTNVADLMFGSASAKTITISFWVRSSLTGTFSGALSNSTFNYSYAFEYSISTADTWEKKTITVSGATAGTWLTTTGIGFQVIFSMGHGSNFDGTVNTWESAGDMGTSGSVAVAGTLDATWQITGVQLEAGSVATPFERRPYGTELQLCQRYFEKSYDLAVVPGTNTADGIVMVDTYYSNARFVATHVPLMVPKRIGNWTLTYWDRVGNLTRTSEYSSATWTDNLTSSGTFLVSQGQNRFLVYPSNSNDNAGFHFTASAEL